MAHFISIVAPNSANVRCNQTIKAAILFYHIFGMFNWKNDVKLFTFVESIQAHIVRNTPFKSVKKRGKNNRLQQQQKKWPQKKKSRFLSFLSFFSCVCVSTQPNVWRFFAHDMYTFVLFDNFYLHFTSLFNDESVLRWNDRPNRDIASRRRQVKKGKSLHIHTYIYILFFSLINWKYFT